jgi:hypothetical protein
MPLTLQAGDVFLTASDSWLGRAIRAFERTPNESPSLVNHTGLILSGDGAVPAVSIEALWHVRVGPFRELYGPPHTHLVAIYRDVTLGPLEQLTIQRVAQRWIGRHYGPFKLVLHALDYAISKVARRDVYAFRRLSCSDRYPICSWIVARAYAETGRCFGCDSAQASPDDVHDWILGHPEKWVCIWPLSRLTEAA